MFHKVSASGGVRCTLPMPRLAVSRGLSHTISALHSHNKGEPMSETGKKQSDPIDVHVGSRIKLRRTMNGMSQGKLGDSLGITFQQIQKYERGTNRVGASRLQNIAHVLNVPLSFFFENAPANDANVMDANVFPRDDFQTFLSSPEGFRLNREFVRIMDPKVRRRILEMVRAIAAHQDEGSVEL